MHELEIINFILDCYSPFDAITLSAMTHKEDPWLETKEGCVISKKKIYDYFSKLKFSKNFPFDPQKPFYPVESNLHYAYIFDMDKEKIEMSYPSFNEYKFMMSRVEDDFEKLVTLLDQKA